MPICSKIFEKLLLDSVYEFLDKNSLLNSNQSGFRPNDSSIHQLTAITHDIFTAFDANPSLVVRGAFLDLSIAFDRVRHKGLLYKPKCNGINGPLLSVVESFLTDRRQRVAFNGQSSNWKNVRLGVPQGSALGPLLFLIYINDLPQGLHADNIKLFADDTSLFSVADDIDESASKLRNDLIRIQEWAYQWKMSFNPDRTKPAHKVIISRKTKDIIYSNLYFNNVPIVKTTSQKQLGLNLDAKLTFNDHISGERCWRSP